MVRGSKIFELDAEPLAGKGISGFMKKDFRLLRLAPVALMWLLVAGTEGGGAHAQQPGEQSSQADKSTLRSSRFVRPVAQRSDSTMAEETREHIPEKVVVVVHRLSGWKLLARLAQDNAYSITASENELGRSNSHTNIVAGCVLNDGRTVIVRLPQAETEVELLGVLPEARQGTRPVEAGEIDLVVARRDGTHVKAKFVGLDSATGLSLLEVDNSLLSFPAQPVKETLAKVGQTISAASKTLEVGEEKFSVNQAVRLFAPEQVRKTETKADTVYLRLSEIRGRLLYTQGALAGRRAPEVVVSSHHLLPGIDGAVALNTAGEFVGIVERSGAGGSAYLMPTSLVHQAARRVLARRASVPQPWLGARGDAVAMTTLAKLTSSGWPHRQASELMHRGQGVLLTAVPPGTPAALAGLRAGDVVTRVGGLPIRSVDDLSQLLRKSGANVPLQFTVQSAEGAPRAITVKLSEAFDPIKATKMALQLAEDDGTPRQERPASPAKNLATIGFEAVVLLAAKAPPQFPGASSLLVTSVRPESMAASGGLRPGDLITSINGKPLVEIKSIDNLFEQIASPLTLSVMRGNRSLTLTLSRLPTDSTERK